MNSNVNILPDEYLYAMRKFLINCDTPTTIALQGEWGSGKTTFWELLRKTSIRKLYENHVEKFNEELSDIGEQDDEKLYFLDTPINTWELSQFNMSDQLSLAVLNRIARCIDDKSELIAGLDFIKKVVKTGINTFANIKINNDHIVDDIFSSEYFEQIDKLKKNFSDSVQKKLKAVSGKTQKERMIIFVDDLDRVEPKKAVEVLECLSLFMCTKNCIFILAVDKDVVIEGAKDRFKDKGEMFFDKIVQLPFPLPTEYYNIETYLNENLATVKKMLKGEKNESINRENLKEETLRLNDNNKNLDLNEISPNIFEFTNDEIENRYLEILRASIGTNPRGIKRIFNLFYVLCEVDRFRFITSVASDIKYEIKVFDLYFWYACVVNSKYNDLWKYILEDVSRNKDKFENKDSMMRYITNFIESEDSKHIVKDDRNRKILIESFKQILVDLMNCNGFNPSMIYGLIVYDTHTGGKLNI